MSHKKPASKKSGKPPKVEIGATAEQIRKLVAKLQEDRGKPAPSATVK